MTNRAPAAVTKLASRRARLEADIYRLISGFEAETGFGVLEVCVAHPVPVDEHEALRWAGSERPLRPSVTVALYSAALRGREPAPETDATYILRSLEAGHAEQTSPA